MERTCEVEDCAKVAGKGLRLCYMHRARLKRTGTTDPWRGPNRSWRGDDIGYWSAHGRARTAKGPAKEHRCVACGEQAAEWAYDHADPNARIERLQVFSPDPEHYLPLCVSCHRRFDDDPDAGLPAPLKEPSPWMRQPYRLKRMAQAKRRNPAPTPREQKP